MKKNIYILFCALCIIFLPVSTDAQTVISGMDDGGIGTLRSQVNLAPAGSEILISDLVTTISLAGEIVITKDITISGLADMTTTIDAGLNGRVFNVVSGTLTLNDIEIVNGMAADGGAIFVGEAGLLMNNCIIRDCVANGPAGSGGAIYIDSAGLVAIKDSRLTANIANRAGGAIEDNSGSSTVLTLEGVVFTENNAGTAPAMGAPGNGGALHITGSGSADVISCTVINNRAAVEGGGFWNGAGEMDIFNTTFTDNSAGGDGPDEGGGALFNAGGRVHIDESVFAENSCSGLSGSGGAILNVNGTLMVEDCEFSLNAASRAGGGIEHRSENEDTLFLTNTQFISNTTGDAPGNGGGVHITGNGMATIIGCGFNGNSAAAEGGGLWNGSGFMLVSGSTIEGNVALGNDSDQGGGGLFNAGGALRVDSSIVQLNMCTGTSGSGGGILNDGGVLVVTDSEISGNVCERAGGGIEHNSSANADLQLINVHVLNNTAGDAPGNGGGVHITGDGHAIIRGGFYSNNIARAEGGGIWNGSGEMVISGATINANQANGVEADQGGGGVFNAGGILRIDSCLISNNMSMGTLGSGGGILNDGGLLTVTNTAIQRNVSLRAGGGIEDNSVEGSLLTLINVELSDNATGNAPGNGGGLHITGPGDARLNGCLIFDNEADAEGGGVWNGTGVMTIAGSMISGNIAAGPAPDQGGGGVFNAGGTIHIEGSAIVDNSCTGDAGCGGGILNDLGKLTVVESEISGNAAVRAGGGIEFNSSDSDTTLLVDVNLSGNTAGTAPGNGGGLHVTGAGFTSIEGGIVFSNQAEAEGGGIWNGSGAMSISGTSILANTASGNEASQGGGGVFNAGGSLLIEGALIADNTCDGNAGSGGGILNDLGTLVVSDTEIRGNTAVRAGGGIENNSADNSVLVLNNVTLSANTASGMPGNGGGLHITGNGDAEITGGAALGNTANSEGGGLWNSTGTMIIAGMQIDSNMVTGVMAGNGGGGIYNSGGTLVIHSNTGISDNLCTGASGSGGGIYSSSGSVSVENTVIAENSANRSGGGIEIVDGELMIMTSSLLRNDVNGTAGTPNPGNGGALHVSGTANVDIVASVMSENVAARDGGAIWSQAGSFIQITESELNDNDCLGLDIENGGGAIFNNGGGISIMQSSMARNEVTGYEGTGGAIHNGPGGTVDLTLSTVSDNAAYLGGAIYNNGMNVSVEKVTITENSATLAGGGIYSETQTSLRSSIVAGNTSTEDDDVSGVFISGNYNLIGSDESNDFPEESGDIEGSDPMLEPLMENPGSTSTHALEEGSPAYNNGDPDDDSPDQLGQPVFDGRRDIGAWEAQEVLTSVENLNFTDLGIGMYPNPAAEWVRIVIPHEFGAEGRAQIYEGGSGKLVAEKYFTNAEVRLNVSDLDAGMYIVKLEANEKSAAQLLTVIE